MSLEQGKIKRIIEAALFAAGRPLNIDKLSKLFAEDERPSNPEIKELLAQLLADYADRGINLVEVANGWRFQSRDEFAEWLQRLWEERPAKYSRASLETLSLIAYRQPVTRSEIEEIRGVSVSSSIIKSFLEREWIRVVGHRDVPGRPALFATTKMFLDYFNLKSLEELPTLSEIKDLEALNPQLDLQEKTPEGLLAAMAEEQMKNKIETTVDEDVSASDSSETDSIENKTIENKLLDNDFGQQQDIQSESSKYH